MKSQRRTAKRSAAVLIYMLVLITLQTFLLVVAVEGFMAHEPGLARTAAVFSVGLFCTALGLLWLLRDG